MKLEFGSPPTSPKSSSTQPLLSPASSVEGSTVLKSATTAHVLRLDVELEKQSFNWLIHHMIPPSPLDAHVSGCELNFPDTAYFAQEDGQGLAGSVGKDIIKTDLASGCIVKIV